VQECKNEPERVGMSSQTCKNELKMSGDKCKHAKQMTHTRHVPLQRYDAVEYNITHTCIELHNTVELLVFFGVLEWTSEQSASRRRPTFSPLLGEGVGDSGNSSGSSLSWMAATVAFCCLGGILMVGFLGAGFFFLAIEYIGV